MVKSPSHPRLSAKALREGGVARWGAALAGLVVASTAHAAEPPVDPTVRGARLVPAEVPAPPFEIPPGPERARGPGSASGSTAFTLAPGVEPGGGVRALAAGLRIVVRADGGVLTAEAPFASAPTLMLVLPERLGGGFLFVLGSVIHRAERWLGTATPIVDSASGVASLTAGFDRVYARAPSGTYQAFDPRTGDPRDLGAFPRGPYVRAFVAIDGWRAVALVDLRGPVGTVDAGATWRPLDVPIDARELRQAGDAIVVEGEDAAHARRAFLLDARGELSETAPWATPNASSEPAHAAMATVRSTSAPPRPLRPDARPEAPREVARRALGGQPLEAAIEDGWPLGDGTAAVARDGALARVRLDDGTVPAFDETAYPLGPSRCHPIPLAPGAFAGASLAQLGFVCGVLQGVTVLYGYQPGAGRSAAGRLVEERRWGAPRVVLPSQGGGVAVRGGCASDLGPLVYCVRRAGGVWRDVRLAASAGSAETPDFRVASFPDGSVAVVTPPHDGRGAELVVHGDTSDRAVPIVWPALDDDRRDALVHGTWLHGFETRAGGRVGGWVETFGTRLGLEIGPDGHATVGPLVRDLGAPVVSGVYGLGFSASRRAYETTDGGLTWSPFEVPEPLLSGRRIVARGCGPVGCNAGGWLRVGWGDPSPGPPAGSPPPGSLPAVRFPRSRNNVALSLACTPLATEPAFAAPALPIARRGGPIVVGALVPAPAATARPLVLDVDALVDRAARLGSVARIRATPGPRGATPTWLVEWTPVFGSVATRQSDESPAPAWLEELVQPTPQSLPASLPLVNLAPGDDPDHALLTVRRGLHAEPEIYALESHRPPVPLRRADGGPFGEVAAALRSGRRWYLAGTGDVGAPMATVIFEAEGGAARELARVPRVGIEGRGVPGGGGVRLGERRHGQEIDLVVDGAATSDRVGPTRWALGIDRSTGRLRAPLFLGSSDLGDRSDLPLCAEVGDGLGGDADPVVVDAPLATPLALSIHREDWGPLQGAFARVRLGVEGERGPVACLETLGGVSEAAASPAAGLTPSGGDHSGGGRLASTPPEANVVVLTGDRRRLLRCSRR